MKRFHFQLERVRRWRLEQLSLEELKLQQVRAERQRWPTPNSKFATSCLHPGGNILALHLLCGQDLENLDSYGIHVHGRSGILRIVSSSGMRKLSEQRGRVLEARRQFELLDGLREKALVKWRAEGEKEQETLAGELFLSRSTRNG